MTKKTTRGKKDDSNRREFLGRIGGATAATIAAGAVVGAKAQDSTGDCEVGAPTGACAIAAGKIKAEGRTVQVIGRVRNGKVIFDQASLEDFARAFPEADMAFVALNAPFDPKSNACQI
jgi:hypothetical protein